MLLLFFDRKRFNGFSVYLITAFKVISLPIRILLVVLMAANIVFLTDGAYGMCWAACLVKRMR